MMEEFYINKENEELLLILMLMIWIIKDQDFVNDEIDKYEINADKVGIQSQYLAILNELKHLVDNI